MHPRHCLQQPITTDHEAQINKRYISDGTKHGNDEQVDVKHRSPNCARAASKIGQFELMYDEISSSTGGLPMGLVYKLFRKFRAISELMLIIPNGGDFLCE